MQLQSSPSRMLPTKYNTTTNHKITEQLYQEFVILKEFINTNSSKKKKQHNSNRKQHNSNRKQHNSNKKKSQNNQKRISHQQQTNSNLQHHKVRSPHNLSLDNISNNISNYQAQLLEKNITQHKLIINTPQPSKKWRNKINLIASNDYSINSDHDQYQYQYQENKQQDNKNTDSEQKVQHPNREQQKQKFDLKKNCLESNNRSQLINEYIEMYQYSIKKVIQNNKRRLRKKRKTNLQHQQQIIIIGKNTDQQKIITKKNVTANNSLKDRQIARKLQFNNNNYSSNKKNNPSNKYNNQQILELSPNIITQTNIILQNIFNPFQFSINKIIQSHNQRLQSIGHKLTKMKLFVHQNSSETAIKENLNKKILKFHQFESLSKLRSQKTQNQTVDNKINDQQQQKSIMQAQNYQKASQQIGIDNKIIDKIQQSQLQFDQFNQQYVPDDTSSLYSETINQCDLQFDDQQSLLN